MQEEFEVLARYVFKHVQRGPRLDLCGPRTVACQWESVTDMQ